MSSRTTLTSMAVLFATGLAFGQTTQDRAAPGKSDRPAALRADAPPGHVEFPRDPYVYVPRDERGTTPGAPVVRNGYVSVQVNVDADGNNIVGDAANEPTIAVDPTDPTRMVIGWRQFDSISSDFRQAGWGFTTDGGLTWTFPGVIEPGVFRSDPVLTADADGVFYYNSLTATPDLSDFWCHVFRSYDGGATWDAGTYAWGGDKQWQTIDRTGGMGDGHLYATWNSFYSACPGSFTRSIDGGESFQSCTSVPSSPYWGTLSVGPDGTLFMSGQGFIVAKSINAQNPFAAVTWTTASVSLGGSLQYGGGPNPGGLLGQAWVATDHSDGETGGHVYVLCSVDPSGSDPLDVMFSRSEDGGQTWSSPVRVNDDTPGNNAWQWFGTISVAPNGRIDVIWLDTRNDPGGYDSELFYSFSEDGGVTWSANEALSPAFDPHVGWPQQNKMGDYFDMISDEFGANLAYAATFNGEQDVYYIRIGDPLCPDAGTVKFDQPKYACESVATVRVSDCGLNTDDETVETVEIVLASTTEPAGEPLVLTEISPAAGTFTGTITLSATDEAGILHVSPDDWITATYIDADDGQGGVDVEVVAQVDVDCTAPVISDVQVADLQAFSATVTFATDEPCRGTVRYGTVCGLLDQTVTVGGFKTEHTITLSVQDEHTYYFAVDAEDEAGNVATDDAGGTCYSFTTPDVPNYFTEQFDPSGNDLAFKSLIFTPDGSNDFYHVCVEEIDALPVNPAGGTVLELGIDDFEQVTLAFGVQVKLYGQSYSSFYIGTNGYLTFNSGDTDWTESLADHFEQPRVSALFDDFNLTVGGTLSWKQVLGSAVVTWQDVPEYSIGGANTFQVEMSSNGVIRMSYLNLSAQDGLTGLSAGEGIPMEFAETDLTALGPCTLPGDMNCDGDVDFGDINPFVLALSNPAAWQAQYPDCDILNGDVNDDGAFDFKDINPFVLLLTGG